jgi:hypothetical protein
MHAFQINMNDDVDDQGDDIWNDKHDEDVDFEKIFLIFYFFKNPAFFIIIYSVF